MGIGGERRCSSQGEYRAGRAWERDTWKADRYKEKANIVAQQVKRAAALSAELATQSEEKTAAACDRPPGLGELAGHIEAPNTLGHDDARPMGQKLPSLRGPDHGQTSS